MMKTMRETASVVALGSATEERDAVKAAFQEVQSSFENFCLLAGIKAFQDLLEEEAADLCGERHQRHEDRRGRRWGKARSPVAFHGGRVDIERPRVRTPDGQRELELPSLAAGQREDWLGRWAMNQRLINVSTRRFRRSVRLPDGDVASARGDGTSKSAVSRKFVALSSAKLKTWLATDLSPLDLLAIQIDGLHVQEDLILVAAVGIDATGEKHPLGLVEGATENAATVQALLDNLVERGLDPAVVRLFIIDGAKALSKAIRRTFGRNTPIQRCQVHKARNIAERLPKAAQATVRKALRQAWEMEDAARAEQRIRNLARRLDKEWPGIAATILEGTRRDPVCRPPGPAQGAAPLSGLHQHHREHERHHPAGQPQREALAGWLDGLALDRCWYDGGQERLPTVDGLQAAADAQSRPAGSSSGTLSNRHQ